MKRVGIWIRVSTDDQARGDSPEHHEKRARYYAEAKEWNVVELYDLTAVSGKTILQHPEAKRMLEDIKSGHITGLIFSKLARLARNTKELLDISDMFREYDADLISLQEAIDTSSPAGRLFFTMIAAMAQWEREEISERVSASVPIRAKLGKRVGGAAQFGYQWKDKEFVIDPNEAPIRKLIYELFSEHKRLKTVARLLNEQGHRTRNGSKFSDTTVRRLIEDPTAKGVRRANYTKVVANKKVELKPEDEWVLIPVEAIVSDELWDKCNNYLTDQRKNRKPPAKKVTNLFSGLTFCECGHKMYVPSNSPKYTCTKCRNKIPIEDLDSVYHEQLKNFHFSPDEVAGYINQADSVIKEKEELLEVQLKEQQKIQKQMDKLYDLYLANEIPKEGFGRKYHPLEERFQQLEEQIPTLQGELDFMKIQFLSSDEIINQAQDLYTRWPKMLHEEKRNIVETVTESITIGKGEIDINLCYLPSFEEVMVNRQQNVMVALPFCHITLNVERSDGYKKFADCETLGDHIRRRRCMLGLWQKEVGKMFGVSAWTVLNWEKNITEPVVRFYPAIMEFLGYCPIQYHQSLGERIRLHRIHLGYSQSEFSSILGVDMCTLSSWEGGVKSPLRHTRSNLIINKILTSEIFN